MRLSSNDCASLIARTSAAAECGDAEPEIAELWEQLHRTRNRNGSGFSASAHALTRRTLLTISDAPDLDRKTLASQIRGNESEISRNFHRDVGMPLIKSRSRLRLMRFVELVDNHAGNLMAAAIAAGFGSYSQCHRSFFAEFGCAPQHFFLSGLRRQMEDAFEPLVE